MALIIHFIRFLAALSLLTEGRSGTHRPGDPLLPCRLSKLVVENAHWFEQAKEGSYPTIGIHPRFRLVEEAPLAEQVDPVAPAFELLAAPESPFQEVCKL
jgi:hypothetical protein